MTGNCSVPAYSDGPLPNVTDGNHEVLRSMSIGKRKLGLENGTEGRMDPDEHGNRGLSEPPSSHTQSTNATMSPHPVLTASSALSMSRGSPYSSTTTTASETRGQHPLAQPPLNANGSNSPSPLPLDFTPIPLAQITNLRKSLSRRRSSYPPATTPGALDSLFSWSASGTPKADLSSLLDSLPGLGEGVDGNKGTGWTPGSNAWEQFIDPSSDIVESTDVLTSMDSQTLRKLQLSASRVVNAPPAAPQSDEAKGNSAPAAPQLSNVLRPPPPTPGKRNIQQSHESEWRSALASVIQIDGVGDVPVLKILQEVWKRGGGDSVTALCLWPSIIVALAIPADSGPDFRVPNPSAQSAMSLQQLYNLTIRHWEPAIFSGLLGHFASGNMPSPAALPADRAFQSQHYGPSTPMRDTDLSQWINLTPGAWSAQHDPFIGSTGQSNLFKPQAPEDAGFPFPLTSGLKAGEKAEDVGRKSLANGVAEEDQMGQSIAEILARMEEEQDGDGPVSVAEDEIQTHSQPSRMSFTELGSQRLNPVDQSFHLPTPETTSSESPNNHNAHNNKIAFSPPTSMSSPFVSAGSTGSVVPTNNESGPGPTKCSAHVKTRPTQVPIPPVDFIPPPPMCMFFNPSFENLQDGKSGVWRGDLEVRGRGGGKFSVLVIGESGMDHLWQSHLWPQSLSYPLKPNNSDECYTSSMIPVSHLAREGLVPITMGMVLCNEPADRIDPYVKMVHGLHAEGVAFHLPCENPRLPVVFLPTKFHANDPLLRLGVAFMGKAGLPYPSAPLSAPRARRHTYDLGATSREEPKNKKRRQSASTGIKPKSGSRRNSKEKEGQ